MFFLGVGLIMSPFFFFFVFFLSLFSPLIIAARPIMSPFFFFFVFFFSLFPPLINQKYKA